MSKTKKIWLGVLSFSPLVVTTLFIGIILLFYAKIIFGAIDGSLAYSDGREFIFFAVFLIIFGLFQKKKLLIKVSVSKKKTIILKN